MTFELVGQGVVAGEYIIGRKASDVDAYHENDYSDEKKGRPRGRAFNLGQI